MLAAKAVDLTPHLSGDNIKKYPYLATCPRPAGTRRSSTARSTASRSRAGAISSEVLYARRHPRGPGSPAEVKSADDFVQLCKG